MTQERDMELLKEAVAAARKSREQGMHPFGAVLADAQGTILLEAYNSVPEEGDVTGHAETNLVRAASKKYSAAFLAGCTLYSSAEPCAMCAGAIYWSGIGRVVYALGEQELLDLTGADAQNPTMNLPCRLVFASGQRHIDVRGPLATEGARDVHAGFWNPS